MSAAAAAPPSPAAEVQPHDKEGLEMAKTPDLDLFNRIIDEVLEEDDPDIKL